MEGSPCGHKRKCFSRYFLPSKESLMSCNSSTIMEVPVWRASALVAGLATVVGLDGLLLCSELSL